jgi:beta-N-acetylglucosaminidase
VLDSSATDYDAIVYNMYGIHAFDSAPTQGGARKAFNAGWTSPEKVIIGGANIIAQSYIYAGQDALL